MGGETWKRYKPFVVMSSTLAVVQDFVWLLNFPSDITVVCKDLAVVLYTMSKQTPVLMNRRPWFEIIAISAIAILQITFTFGVSNRGKKKTEA